MKTENSWNTYSDTQKNDIEALSQRYKKFLNNGKTERECVKEIIKLAEKRGYKNIDDVEKNNVLKPGDKVYSVMMKKAVALFNIGSRPLKEGMNILGAHIDSPRLDVKQNPLYEDSEIAYFDTHYYGGIKKYQWVALPLAIHGVVAKKDGICEISIGEKDDEPVLFVSDLLIHLSQKQLEKKAATVIEGEDLNVTIGNIPLKGDEKDAVKANILKLLKERYGISEQDFISAELEIVPAGKARDCGLDRSMIMSYGQDDRVCAYTSLEAMLNVEKTERTSACILVDKEEIGSVGATGMQSRFFENAVARIMNMCRKYSEFDLRMALQKSKMLSSDVSSAFDPIYAAAFEKNNVAYISHGMVFNKFTGARGKSGSNDANAEYIAELRKIMDDENVKFQTAELGRVDLGGGGTIAYILALYGMEVIDSGIAVLNMHAPWEVTSKADLYETERGYEAFIKNAGKN
ncbi:MAG: aminopeptidase [Clostridia bacterium]|nr:aminopeptidase [Clostridia bacterium]MCI1999319.1 aminopeptidase [Clostridia bacterium]MCI2015179.1 aminopeptidase [Clostridia bacterium]